MTSSAGRRSAGGRKLQDDDTDSVRFQIRLEAFNLFNSDVTSVSSGDTSSADFGRMQRHRQSNFQRFIQMGFRLRLLRRTLTTSTVVRQGLGTNLRPLPLTWPRFLAVTLLSTLLVASQDRTSARRVGWDELTPVRARLEAAGLSASSFPAFVERVHTTNLQRVREGDLDHLIFYVLQSTRLPGAAIEPALSAKALVESLPEEERRTFLTTGRVDPGRLPAGVRARVAALLRAFERPSDDPRLAYFRQLVDASFPDSRQRQDDLLREYARAMRFLYEKEFVAQRAERPADAVAELYRSRGLSTDNAIEAGYLVHLSWGRALSTEPGTYTAC